MHYFPFHHFVPIIQAENHVVLFILFFLPSICSQFQVLMTLPYKCFCICFFFVIPVVDCSGSAIFKSSSYLWTAFLQSLLPWHMLHSVYKFNCYKLNQQPLREQDRRPLELDKEQTELTKSSSAPSENTHPSGSGEKFLPIFPFLYLSSSSLSNLFYTFSLQKLALRLGTHMQCSTLLTTSLWVLLQALQCLRMWRWISHYPC